MGLVRRLTAATLPAAEAAPTARVDWRRALRNILKDVSEGGRRKGEQLQRGAIGGGEIEAGGAAFAESKLGEILQRRADSNHRTGRSADSEGDVWV